MIRRDVLEALQRILLAVLVMIGLAVSSVGIHAAWTGAPSSDGTPLATLSTVTRELVVPTAAPNMTSLPTSTLVAGETVTDTPARSTKIGIVAGHWKHDSGAVCPDGLQEVDINLDIAQRVVALLALAGYEAEILAEFSPKLEGYEATALVSIHTDSCNVPEASGFKAARVNASAVPELEDRLVACLIDRYHEATGLQFHRNSITYDMTEYHAFYEVAPETPAAIIEIGFMDADRRILTRRQDSVAQGIVNGIKCFIDSVR